MNINMNMDGITRVVLGVIGFIFAIFVLEVSYRYFNGLLPGAKTKDILLLLGGLGLFSFISLTLSFGKWKLSR